MRMNKWQKNFWVKKSFTNLICPAIVSTDRERIILGTEDGLFVVELTRDSMSILYYTDLVIILNLCLCFHLN